MVSYDLMGLNEFGLIRSDDITQYFNRRSGDQALDLGLKMSGWLFL
jgi:hypothetical protein